MDIDEPTLMLVLGVASITASAMFFTLHASARHIGGVRSWAYACLAVGFAVLLDAPRLVGNWQWASLLFNIPFSVGQALLLAGTAQFVGRRWGKHTLTLLIALAVLLTLAFTLVLPDSALRIFTQTLYQACLNALSAWYLWHHRERQSSRAYGVAAAIFLGEAAAALAQGVFVMISTLPVTYAAPELPLANIVNWAGVLANTLLGNWILFLLVMLRLVRDLQTDAMHDPLTGLLNRRGLRSHINSLLAPGCSLRSLAVLLLDIDHSSLERPARPRHRRPGPGHDGRGHAGPRQCPCRAVPLGRRRVLLRGRQPLGQIADRTCQARQADVSADQRRPPWPAVRCNGQHRRGGRARRRQLRVFQTGSPGRRATLPGKARWP